MEDQEIDLNVVSLNILTKTETFLRQIKAEACIWYVFYLSLWNSFWAFQ